MSWHDLATQAQELGPLQGLAGQRVDLHALWAGASRLAGYRERFGSGSERLVTVMVELRPAVHPQTHQAICTLIGAPQVYAGEVPQPAPGTNRLPRFITGTMPLANLVALAALAAGRFSPVRRWRLGLPQIARPEPERPLEVSLPPLDTAIRPPWIGIIDHGFGLAQQAFRLPGTGESRLVLLWDQDPVGAGPALVHWRREAELGYGACLSGADVKTALATNGGDEMAVYRHFGYRPAQFRATHGTHVLDLAAGYPHPLSIGRPDAASWDGCAAYAPIVAVQLPYLPNKDTSGAGLGVHVLDALHFIATYAKGGRTTRPDVVINLSDGAYGGRHDGRSMTEEAIDDFLRTHPHVQLVVAAGNAGNQDLHAVSGPLAAGGEVGVDWQVLPGDTSDSFCEVWLEGPAQPGTLELVVEPPGGLPAIRVPLGQGRAFRDPAAAGARCAVLSTTDAVNHGGRAGFLVAVGATAWPTAGRALAPHGRWRLRLQNLGPWSLDAVHMWVERDSPVGNEGGPRRQSRLRPYPGGGMALSPVRTLGSLAGSQETFVVDGYGLRGAWPTSPSAQPLSDVPPYVSRGPGRVVPAGGVDGPDIAAPCDESPALPGLLAAGTRSGTRLRMNGTSVAAPLVTRRLVDIVASQPLGPAPNRKLLRDALRAPGGVPTDRLQPGPATDSPCLNAG